MTVEAWKRQLKKGAFCAVSLSEKQPLYGYARLLEDPEEKDVKARLHTELYPAGRTVMFPLKLITIEITAAQFEAARIHRFPSNPESGQVLCNQSTHVLGIA